MYCEHCKQRPATLHFTKIINNEKTEVHLCEQCAQEMGEINAMFTPFSITDLLSSFLEVNKEGQKKIYNEQSLKCKQCGFTFNDIKKTGRLGCGHCYVIFKEQLMPILKRIQGRTEHSGKVPRKTGGQIWLNREIKRLKRELSKAVADEAYERAAQLRDEIRELEGKSAGELGGRNNG